MKAIALFLVFGAAASVRAQDESHQTPLTAGASTGAMRFGDERLESGVTGVVRYHLRPDLSIAVTPTFARMAYPATLGGGSTSGFTDVPVEVGYDHALPFAGSPTVGAAFGVSLPVGDTATGFGSGVVGTSVSVGLGASPSDQWSLHVGAGRPLSDFSAQGALGAQGGTWAEAEASYAANAHLSATAGVDGDLSSSDSSGAARALAGGLTYALPDGYALSLHAAHGISGPAATWSLSLGFGTDFNPLGAIGSSSSIQRFMHSFGQSRTYGAAVAATRRRGGRP